MSVCEGKCQELVCVYVHACGHTDAHASEVSLRTETWIPAGDMGNIS